MDTQPEEVRRTVDSRLSATELSSADHSPQRFLIRIVLVIDI